MTKGTLAAKFAGIAVVLGLVAASPVRADRAPEGLGEMIANSDRIVIGSVVDVSDTMQPGQHVATINVEEELKGSGPSALNLLGYPGDPDRASFFDGSRVLAFLVNGPNNRIFPVAKAQGIIVIGDDSVDAARNIVNRALLMGSALKLVDVVPELRLDRTPPPALLGILFEELSTSVDGTDSGEILEIACRPIDYVSHAATFAVTQVGRLGLPDGRPCLERIIRNDFDRGLSILSIDALGELGDAASVQLLASLLPSYPLPPRLVLADDEPDGAVGPEDDPEDDTAISDPGEDDDQIVPLPVDPEIQVPGNEPFDDAPDDDALNDQSPPPVEPDGDDEPQVGDDLVSRGADGGMAMAAILALGKIGSPAVIPPLSRIAREGDDLGLHSTVVRALGLIGDPAIQALTGIKRQHPNPLVRRLADQTILRLQG